jgi:hypothetical protein
MSYLLSCAIIHIDNQPSLAKEFDELLFATDESLAIPGMLSIVNRLTLLIIAYKECAHCPQPTAIYWCHHAFLLL